jgi:hypothetical protein
MYLPMAKLSKAEWADVRKEWELDARDGHQWLADILMSRGFDVNRVAIAKAAKRQGWKKITQGEKVTSKVTKPEKKSPKKVTLTLVSDKSRTENSVKNNSIESAAKKIEGQKNGPGRPTLYSESYDELAYRACLLGLTNDGLGLLFSVDDATINRWMIAHPSFSDAVKAGRLIADAKVAESLYNRAIGYSHPETKVFNNMGEIIEHDVIKHYPPDTGAARNWLCNRQPKLWKNQPETVAEVNFNVVPQAELDRIHAVNLEKQKELMATVMGRAARLGIVTSYIDSSATLESENE